MLSSESNIHFIVNPVSGSATVPFELLGKSMAEAENKTTLRVTTVNYSASDCVGDALADDANLIVVYGGDGTVMEVANCLQDQEIPLAIIPGGTANVIAHELKIPVDTQAALDLIFHHKHQEKWIDAGRVGDEHFLLRFSIGWEAELSQRPTTEDKSRWGILAYTQAALQALNDLEPVTYRMTLDDDTVEEISGINCSICNIGSAGFQEMSIGTDICPDDGLLDVLILQNKNTQAVLDIAQNVLASSFELDLEESLPHYKAKKVEILPDSPQRMSLDGEAFESAFPITFECIPRYVSILTPKTI